ncbi:hypothetical protein O9S75_24645, partial [Escherichia coli]|uniref:hypothetical protein n=1 Tax=Escherichia coli TaxID=562 RepID=UPI0039C443E9
MLSTSFDTIDTNIPLVVDLDGTLSKTDTLHEGIISVLFKNPIKIIGMCLALMNPLMILVKIIKLRWIHILSYDQMVSRKINNQTTRCANSIF